jgi:voltage-gated potassium channel
MYVPVNRPSDVSPSAGHIITSLAFLVVVVAGGVVGYMVVEDLRFVDALYMTVITVSTVGFKEVRALSATGMYFTIGVIVFGVSAMLFFLASLFEFILSEYLGDIWGRRRMEKDLSKLVNHYIVCGYGRVGRSVSDELNSQGKPFVVIEKDPEILAECIEDGLLAVQGSATDNEVLETAGISTAVGLVSALRSDADNLYVVLTARVLRPDIILIARADQPDAAAKLGMVGADRVVSPHQIAGRRMANLLTRPGACEFLDVVTDGNLPEYQLTELRVGKDSPIKQKSIGDTRLRERIGVTILAVRKSGQAAFNPNPPTETVLDEGDEMILIGTPEQMSGMEESGI